MWTKKKPQTMIPKLKKRTFVATEPQKKKIFPLWCLKLKQNFFTF